ncbi:MAG: DUF190 domain-containing protein [Firmicutes bacterium]|nr:DUF190 domain-containing protein [Bacillota bacterium]
MNSLEGDAQRLSIYLGEDDHYGHHPLYHAIVLKAREMGLAGATVTRAFEGYGATTRIHTDSLLDLSADLPIIVEIIDQADAIAAFLPVLKPMVTGGLITLESIHIVKYAHKD